MIQNKIALAIALTFLIISCLLVYYFILRAEDETATGEVVSSIESSGDLRVKQRDQIRTSDTLIPDGTCPLENCAADVSGIVLRFEDSSVVISSMLADGELLDTPIEVALELPSDIIAKHFSVQEKKYIEGELMNVGDYVQFVLQEQKITQATVLK